MKKGETGRRRAYIIRMPIILAIWGGSVFVIMGTALLFSFFPSVDWRVCAALGTCLFLAFIFLVVYERSHHSFSFRFICHYIMT